MTTDNMTLNKTMLTEIQGAISALMDKGKGSDNLEVVQACDLETEQSNKMQELQKQQDDLKQRIELTKQKKPKAKGDLNLGSTKTNPIAPAIVQITPVIGTSATFIQQG